MRIRVDDYPSRFSKHGEVPKLKYTRRRRSHGIGTEIISRNFFDGEQQRESWLPPQMEV
jgi:hypothetical protein